MRKRTVGTLLCGVALGFSAMADPAEPAGARNPEAFSRSCVFDHLTLWTPSGTCRPRARQYPVGVAGSVRRAIYDSALIFSLPYTALLQVARCESGLNPRARNGVYRGLFQFLPRTFSRASTRMRRETGIMATSVWSARDASYAAGYMFVTRAGGSWTCARMATVG